MNSIFKLKYQPIALTALIACGCSFANSAFSNSELCKAAISSEMGRKVKIMKTLKSSDELPEIEYVRDDGDSFKYQCRIQGDKVVWRAYFNDHLKKGWGRWRDTDPNDSILTFKVMGGVLSMHNSSTGTSKNFTKKDF